MNRPSASVVDWSFSTPATFSWRYTPPPLTAARMLLTIEVAIAYIERCHVQNELKHLRESTSHDPRTGRQYQPGLGDCVMLNQEGNIWRGRIGTIQDIDHKSRTVIVRFSDGTLIEGRPHHFTLVLPSADPDFQVSHYY